jgi:hypothetical protein
VWFVFVFIEDSSLSLRVVIVGWATTPFLCLMRVLQVGGQGITRR